MKKTSMICCLFSIFTLGVFAQETCEEKIEKASKILKSDSPFKNFTQLFSDLEPCAVAGDPQAQNYIGLFYIEGLGVEKDEEKGFSYIEQAAMADYPMAQVNLGRLYKQGIGCTLSMSNAIDWFTKGANNGNSKAAYSLGYMYYKGLGVDQDYKEAVKWFELSPNPMAKHWLGVCSYLGYGVSQNTDAAIAYLTRSNTVNSATFLKHIQAELKEKKAAEVARKLEEAAAQSIASPVIAQASEITKQAALLQNQDLAGAWIGKFIEYDESGKHIERVSPIEMSFTKDNFGDLITNIVFNGETIEDYVLFEDNNLFIDKFKYTQHNVYPHHPKNLVYDYQVLGMDVNKQVYNNTPYLLMDVDVFHEQWKEIAKPVSLVLRPKTDEAISKQEEEVLLGLAAQKEEFIKLYPVPFVDQLNIAFELETTSTVQVQVTGVNTGETIAVEPGKELQAGSQTYTVNGNSLAAGMYVVKVITNSQVFTRIIVKQ